MDKCQPDDASKMSFVDSRFRNLRSLSVYGAKTVIIKHKNNDDATKAQLRVCNFVLNKITDICNLPNKQGFFENIEQPPPVKDRIATPLMKENFIYLLNNALL